MPPIRPQEMLGTCALVIEAHAATRAGLRNALSEWGMRVATASSLAEGIQSLSAARESGQPIAVVIVGANLSDGEGINLPQELARVRIPASRTRVGRSVASEIF